MIGISGLLDGYYFWWCPIYIPKSWDSYHPLLNKERREIPTPAKFGKLMPIVRFFLRAAPADYPAWWTYKKQWKMAIEIVDLPIKKGDFPLAKC